MNFLSPLFLWMLPLIVTPILIYLFNKNRYRKIKFSSIKLLNEIDDKSIKKFNLVNMLLIIIRTLIILSLILMISRPIYKSFFSNQIVNNSNSIIILGIDNSFSMQDELNSPEIKKYIKKIVDSFSKNKNIIQIILMNDNSIIYDGLIDELKIKNLNLKTSHSSNKLTHFLDYFKIDEYSNYLNKYLFIITDMQRTKENKDYNDKYSHWNINFIEIDNPVSNLAIKNSFIRNEIILPGEKLDIYIEIANTGFYNEEDRLLELFINEINVGKQIINLKEGETETYFFSTVFPSSGNYKCRISLDQDNIIDDNYFYFNIEILNDVEISIIDSQSNLFLNNAMSVLSKNKTYFNFKRFIDLSDYLSSNVNSNFIFISGFKLFNSELINKIESLAVNSNIVIFPDLNDKSYDRFSKYIEDDNLISGYINELNQGKYTEINRESIFDPVFYDIFEKNNINISKYIASKSGPNTLIALKNDDFFLNKYRYKENNLYIFSLPLDLRYSDLTIRAAFLPLINKIINSSNGFMFDYTDKYLNADDFYLLNKIISPKGKIFNYNKNYDDYYFNEVGVYEMYDINNKIKHLSINIPKNEFVIEKNSINHLRRQFENLNIINEINDIQSIVESQARGLDLWRHFLIFSLILLLLEMYLSNMYIKNE